jgi:hypothetical protein
MDAPAKQQVVERVKQATNILVTISTDPSVDQLAACIGLTLLLNRMEKHATAVFSGQVPSTLEFLQPEKTIETNTDSLRDFIISLDKNKADKLRYKVEDQVVRIFITPYKTSLSEKDLVFSQGDINVEVVMALGIKNRTHIDAAITAHGRILHDATVINLIAGPGNLPPLGQINWQEPTASSLSEMLVSISEAFGPGLIDNQIATAFLTGIVAETQRFSNTRTSPKTMTMAAQLMAAGANQQLIVSKLEPPQMPPAAGKPAPKPQPPKPPMQPKDKGTLSVSHDKDKGDSSEVEIAPGEIHIDEKGNLTTTNQLEDEVEQLRKLRQQEASVPESIPLPSPLAPLATAVPPEAPKPHELLDPVDHKPAFNSPFTADTQAEWIDPYNSVTIDPLSGNSGSAPGSQTDGFIEPSKTIQPPAEPPKTPLTAAALANPVAVGSAPGNTMPAVDNARSAVESAIASSPFDPAFAPPVNSLNAQTMGPELHGSRSANITPSLQLPTNGAPAPAADIAPPAPPTVPPPLVPINGQ